MTPKEYECLEFIKRFTSKKPYSPTLTEIASEIGLAPSSKGRASEIVHSLIAQGFLIKNPKRCRSLQLVDQLSPVACVACEDTLMEGDWKTISGVPVCINARPCSKCKGGASTVTERGHFNDNRGAA